MGMCERIAAFGPRRQAAENVGGVDGFCSLPNPIPNLAPAQLKHAVSLAIARSYRQHNIKALGRLHVRQYGPRLETHLSILVGLIKKPSQAAGKALTRLLYATLLL